MQHSDIDDIPNASEIEDVEDNKDATCHDSEIKKTSYVNVRNLLTSEKEDPSCSGNEISFLSISNFQDRARYDSLVRFHILDGKTVVILTEKKPLQLVLAMPT